MCVGGLLASFQANPWPLVLNLWQRAWAAERNETPTRSWSIVLHDCGTLLSAGGVLGHEQVSKSQLLIAVNQAGHDTS